jgi:cytochrome c oxidase subunit 2
MNKTSKFRKIFCTLAAFITATFMTAPAFAILGQPVPEAIILQESGSPMKTQQIYFHDHLLMPIITVISLFVLLLLIIVVVRFNAKANPVPSKATHNTLLEVVWTLIPVIVLVCVAVPSLKMLYYVDRTTEAEMTLKVIGHQWFWSYEFPDNGNFSVISNIVKDDKGNFAGNPRLLEVDTPIELPINTNIKILTASTDVIHSWAEPAFGVKMDAVPGRINETWVRIDKEGTYYGQCSQLCGQNHAYMPIEVKAVSKEEFAAWVKKQGGKMPAAAGTAAAATPADAPAAKKAAKKSKTKKTGDQ